MVFVEIVGGVDEFVKNEGVKVVATAGVERPIEPVDGAQHDDVCENESNSNCGEKRNIVRKISITGAKLANDVAEELWNNNSTNVDIDGNNEEEDEGADFVTHECLPKIIEDTEGMAVVGFGFSRHWFIISGLFTLIGGSENAFFEVSKKG